MIVPFMTQRLLLFGLALAAAHAQSTGSIRGGIVDARGGEALANVQVQLAGSAFRAVSDSKGAFEIAGIPPGDYMLNVSTVGYHLANQKFHLEAGETKEFDVVLTSDALRQTDTVEAKTDPFETSHADSPSTLVLAGNDIKNLGSVLADDPLRAVQNLPGVTSNNDFDARFSLRGADYGRIGLYLDNVLLHQPFHMLQGQNVSGSGTAFNGDMVEVMELHEGAYPVRFEDRSAGALDVQTREGSREGFSFRIAASASNAGVMAEGPLGGKKRGSWLVATRKSYLQYILARTFPDNSFIFGLEDVQGRFTYDLSEKSKVTLYLLESFSNIDRGSSRSTLGINSLLSGGYHYTLGNLGWRFSPTDKLLIATHAAWMREKWDNENPTKLPLGAGYYGEWAGNVNATWMWSSRTPLDFGASARRLRDEGYGTQYQSTVSTRILDRFRGAGTRTGSYAQQSLLAWNGRVHVTAGVRWDHENVDRDSAISPQASISVMATRSTRLQLGWGQYVQFPELSVLWSILGNRYLPPDRSNQTIAAVEQRVGARTRLRAEWYNRADRDLVFQPLALPRMIAPGRYFSPPLNPSYAASLRGYSRGAEFFLQRSSANKFTGWVSYAFGRTNYHDGVLGNWFPSDFDQRHTVNAYGSYRLKPTVNISLRWSYGSAFPLPAYLSQSGSQYFLAPSRNQLRLPAYQRTDLRVNKAWTHNRWKLTLYGEVINLTNRTNYVFDSLNGYNTKTGLISITTDKMFPILPSAGIVFER
jgi:hypothetical protein